MKIINNGITIVKIIIRTDSIKIFGVKIVLKYFVIIAKSNLTMELNNTIQTMLNCSNFVYNAHKNISANHVK